MENHIDKVTLAYKKLAKKVLEKGMKNATLGDYMEFFQQDTAEHLFCLHASWDDEDYKEWLEEMSK